MSNLHKVIDGDTYNRVIVVSDVHGEYDKLMSQLQGIGFNKHTDLLVVVGDMVDRGLKSYECGALYNEDWVEGVVGNHEMFCVKGLYDERHSFYHKMLNNGGEWFYKIPETAQINLVETFKSLPYMLEVIRKGKRYAFVHGDLPYDDWDHCVECLINGDTLQDQGGTERDFRDWLIWSRSIADRSNVQIAGVDHMYVGHTPVGKPKKIGNVTLIDSGSVFFRTDLNLIELE